MKKSIPTGMVLVFLFAAIAPAETASRASLIADVETIQPGRPFSLGVLINLEKGWHTYWINPGDSGMPPDLDWQLPGGCTAGPLQYPIPQVIDEESLQTYGYTSQVLFIRKVTPPAILTGTTSVFSVKAAWLICSDACVPQRAELTLALPNGAGESDTPSRWGPAFNSTRRELPFADPAWSFQATAREGGLTLSILPPAGEPADTLARSRFIPMESGVLAVRSTERQRTAAGYSLAMKKQFPTARLPDRLQGLLLLPPVAENDNGKRAIPVDVPIVEDITTQAKENGP
ncbi:MAG: protein-disulfide reductase DsbD family protein [Kiritimatiellia bacterium]